MGEGERITWRGELRASLDNMEVVPRPDAGQIPIWLSTGGNPSSTVRAAQLGLPVSYGFIGGDLTRFAPLGALYHQAAAQLGVPGAQRRISVGSPGFLADTSQEARRLWWPQYRRTMAGIMGRGLEQVDPRGFEASTGSRGALLVGDPQEVADRIVWLHGLMGHDRHVLQLDRGAMPQRDLLHAVELLGRVKPLVDRALADAPATMN